VIRAAFIGVDRYSDPLIGDLNGAVRDATALWAILSDSIDGLSAALITNSAASLAGIEAALDATLAWIPTAARWANAGYGLADRIEGAGAAHWAP
jgi:hypothetical protein